MIPLSSCNRAADVLVEWFGREELQHVVGGEKWWQVRGLDGVEAEWVAEKISLARPRNDTLGAGHRFSRQEETIRRMDDLEPVMVRVPLRHLRITLFICHCQMYIHGGKFASPLRYLSKAQSSNT